MAGLIIALVVSLAWAAASVWFGPRLGFVDVPDDPSLKAHVRPAVPLGGVGVFLGIHAGLAAEGVFDPGLAIATGGALLLGLVDDRIGLAPAARLLAETLVALALVAWWIPQPGVVEWAVGVPLVVVAINAVNLFDGLDGLVGASGVVAGAGLAWLAVVLGADPNLGLVLTGALAGFLVLNWHPARVFLGDNGSYVVGVFLAAGILGVRDTGGEPGLVAGLLLLGVFGLDLVVTILRRRIHGRPLFAGDRSHLYDQLASRGWPVPWIALTAALVQAGFVLATLLLAQTDSTGLALLVALLVGAAALAAAAAGGFITGGGIGTAD